MGGVPNAGLGLILGGATGAFDGSASGVVFASDMVILSVFCSVEKVR